MIQVTTRRQRSADVGQWTLLPECLDDFIDEDNPVRVIDVFVDSLDLAEMSFAGVPGPSGHMCQNFGNGCAGKRTSRARTWPFTPW